jgi:hypothetical protein
LNFDDFGHEGLKIDALLGLCGIAADKPGGDFQGGEKVERAVSLAAAAGLAGWDGGTLASALGVSDAAVWRVLRKEGIQLRGTARGVSVPIRKFAAKAAVQVSSRVRTRLAAGAKEIRTFGPTCRDAPGRNR